MSAEDFMNRGEETLKKIRTTQLSAIKKAASWIADSVANSGALHYFDRGHCTGELLGRAGGLFAIYPIGLNVNVDHSRPPSCPERTLPPSQTLASWDQNEHVLDFLLDRCYFRKGDVLLLCSVSGSSSIIVNLALGAQKRGVKTIAITSPTYSKSIKSHHPSGKFLYQVADLVIDNCGEVGDALLEIPGLDSRACPSSGLAFVYIAWSLIAQVLRNLTERGIKPQVYKSVNLPDGPAFNEKARAIYERTGI
jgi:uncharacterized phosphosugar-binding protein